MAAPAAGRIGVRRRGADFPPSRSRSSCRGPPAARPTSPCVPSPRWRAKHLGQPVIVDNAPAASGTLGPATMAATGQARRLHHRADADHGLPLPADAEDPLGCRRRTSPTSSISPATCSASSRAPTARSRPGRMSIDYAKANPGKVTYGTPGAGTSLHIGMEQIAAKAASSSRRCRSRAAPRPSAAVLGGHTMLQAEDRLEAAGRCRQARVC